MDSPSTSNFRRPRRQSAQKAIEKMHLWTKRVRTAITCEKYDDAKVIKGNNIKTASRRVIQRKSAIKRERGDLHQIATEVEIECDMANSESMSQTEDEKKENIQNENVDKKSALSMEILHFDGIDEEVIVAINEPVKSTPQPTDTTHMSPKLATYMAKGINPDITEMRNSNETLASTMKEIYVIKDGVKTSTPLWGEIYDRLVDFNFGNVSDGIGGYSQDVFEELGLNQCDTQQTVIENDVDCEDTVICIDEEQENITAEINDNLQDEEICTASNELELSNLHDDWTRQIAVMIATLSGQYQLAQAAQDFIIKTIQKLPPTDNKIINRSTYTLRNEKARKTYYEQTMNYVPAEERVLNLTYRRKGKQFVKHKNTFMMVPLEKSLRRMLLSGDVRKSVTNSTPVVTESGKTLYVLELSLSFDEIQISSPIGQAKAKHKLMVCYFDLLNCPDFVRSKLDFKMLVFVVESKLLQKSTTSLRRVLSNVINTVNNSVNGIQLITTQTEILFRVVIKQYPADNLAAHQIFGMKTGFSSMLRPCRLCYITREDMKTCFNPRKFNLRTNESYEEELQQKHEADIRGLTIKGHPFIFRSPLTDIIGFDIEQLIFDPFHVILCGGVLCKAIIRLLKHVVIEMQLITLADLNEIIRTWKYPPKTGSDRPPTLPVDFFRGDVHLNMKGSSTYVLAQELPFMLYNILPEDDVELLLFCECLQLSQFILHGIEANLQSVLELEQHTQTYLYRRMIICGVDDFTPKLHYFCHLCIQMRKFGVLRKQSTVRFEGQYRTIAKKNYSNFKNLAKSVAEYVQNRSMVSFENISWQEIEAGCFGSDLIGTNEYYLIQSDYKQLLNNCCDINSREALKSVTIKGNIITKGDVIEVTSTLEYFPQFGKVDGIGPVLILGITVAVLIGVSIRAYS
ncbi:unnamed protein product [Allacma fusca]|uniref:Uncharacterized protein n=1 Tax=Allacma fusca TaxID=39272 RepID=A0A8J2NWR0_9HEXA|nr:unnamed protein product [Allacma fusca]